MAIDAASRENELARTWNNRLEFAAILAAAGAMITRCGNKGDTAKSCLLECGIGPGPARRFGTVIRERNNPWWVGLVTKPRGTLCKAALGKVGGAYACPIRDDHLHIKLVLE